jgi:hypothetical protein
VRLRRSARNYTNSQTTQALQEHICSTTCLETFHVRNVNILRHIYPSFLIVYLDIAANYEAGVVADNAFKLVPAKKSAAVEDLVRWAQSTYFERERSITGKLEINGVHLPPVSAACTTHEDALVFALKDLDGTEDVGSCWKCSKGGVGIHCEINVVKRALASIEYRGSKHEVKLSESMMKELYDLDIDLFYTDYTTYKGAFSKVVYAVFQVVDGWVVGCHDGPYEHDALIEIL